MRVCVRVGMCVNLSYLSLCISAVTLCTPVYVSVVWGYGCVRTCVRAGMCVYLSLCIRARLCVCVCVFGCECTCACRCVCEMGNYILHI